MKNSSQSVIVKGAVITGVINAFINGGIQYLFLKK
jgi:hypothetical protein